MLIFHYVPHFMMKLVNWWFLTLCTICLISSCAFDKALRGPSLEEQAKADHGEIPPDYKELVKEHFYQNLFDPYSAKYEFCEPYKAWASYYRPQPHVLYGWAVCGTVNAKNRLGGYTGRKLFWSFFHKGKLIEVKAENPAIDPCTGYIKNCLPY